MLPTPPARTPGTYASSDWVVPRSVWSLLPARWIRALGAFPIAVARGARRTTIVVAMAHPGDLAAIDDIAFATGMDVRVVAASREAIDRAIATHLGPEEPPGPDGEVPSRAPEPGNALPRAQSWFVSPRGL
jgi:hypothetical protein